MLEGAKNYQPSKTQAFWLCVAAIVATMVIGFKWGGWMTAGGANMMSNDAATEARVAVAAGICVHQFKQAPDANARLAALKEESSYSRDGVIEEAGWATMPGSEEPADGVADECADRLVKLESIPTTEQQARTTTGDGEPQTVVQ